MGELARAAREVSASSQPSFGEQLQRYMPRLSQVMPRNVSPERFYQLAVSAYNSVPKLSQCSMQSILSSLMRCASLGLEPDAVDGLGRMYVVPRYNSKTRAMEATTVLGYKGMLELARRSGGLSDISARAVYEGDSFDYEFGLDERLSHVPSPEPKEGRELAYVYCVARFRDGGHYIDVMSRSEVDAVRRRFHTGRDGKLEDFGPWATDYESMARKTVLRRAFPYLPVSAEAQSAAASDETAAPLPVAVAEVVAEEPVAAPEPEEVAADGEDS